MIDSKSTSPSSSYWIPLIIVSFLNCILILLLAFLFSSPSTTYNDVVPHRYHYYSGNCLKQECDNRETIVVIPGLDGATTFFENIVPLLTSVEGFAVIVYNIPLYTSTMKDDEYNFEYLANQLKDIIEELNISSVHIIGESFGGVIAQYFATLHSNRTKSLSLLSSLAKTDLPPFIQWKLTYLVPILKAFGNIFPGLGQAIFARLHVDDVMEPSEGQYVRDLFIKEASVAHFRSVMRRISIVSKLNIEEETKTITSPTLIIYGNDDHFTKTSSMKLSSLINNSKLIGMDGGHLPHVSKPQEFASIVMEFIKKNIQ